MRFRFKLLAGTLALVGAVAVVQAASVGKCPANPATASDLPKGAAAKAMDAKAPKYKVECPKGANSATQCKVGKPTFMGWLTFQTTCFVCHGNGGVGTTFAPNLQDRFNQHGVDFAVFSFVLQHGYRGEIGIMPCWKDNPRVMNNIDNLYRYLKARADGKLPLGRPQVLASK